MAQAHADAWERAATDRQALEVAAYGVELVASDDSCPDIEELRAFLDGAAYSGSPRKRRRDHIYPTAGLAPVDIEPKAIEVAGPFAPRAARELWGRAAPDAIATLEAGLA